MSLNFGSYEAAASLAARSYRLEMTERAGIPHEDADGIDETMIRDVVDEFYRRARLDDRIGPVFESRIGDWDFHLARMADFWSSALLRSGRYSGHPVEIHRTIPGLNRDHFDRWVELFEATVRDLCPPSQAEAFLSRAQRMRTGMTKILM
jgi:hemoglobin